MFFYFYGIIVLKYVLVLRFVKVRSVMERRVLAIIMMVVCAAGWAGGEYSRRDAGTYAGQFLKMGAGARPSGMGEAFVAVSNDSTAIYWNPAGASQLDKVSMTFMHSILIKEISYEWFSCVYPTKAGNFGVGVQYMYYGQMKETDETGLEIGAFMPYDMSVGVSYANELYGLMYGFSVKQITSQIKSLAGAYAADAGLMYKLFGDRVSLGASVQNMGTTLKYVDIEEKLPVNIKYGAACELLDDLSLSFEADMPQDNEGHYGAGIEYIRFMNFNLTGALRAGYATRTKDVPGLSGFTAGVGINYLEYTLDYAFLPFGDLGDTHRISFGYRF